jgi:hypothetical protein
MTIMYVSEYAESGLLPGGMTLGQEPCLDQAPVSYAGGATQSAAFKNNTRMVRIHVDSIASILFGINPTAITNSNKRLAASTTEYFLVPLGLGYKVSAVTST